MMMRQTKREGDTRGETFVFAWVLCSNKFFYKQQSVNQAVLRFIFHTCGFVSFSFVVVVDGDLMIFFSAGQVSFWLCIRSFVFAGLRGR